MRVGNAAIVVRLRQEICSTGAPFLAMNSTASLFCQDLVIIGRNGRDLYFGTLVLACIRYHTEQFLCLGSCHGNLQEDVDCIPMDGTMCSPSAVIQEGNGGRSGWRAYPMASCSGVQEEDYQGLHGWRDQICGRLREGCEG